MKISTKVRYGLRALVELARNGGSEPMEAGAIAFRQDLSKKYLDNLLAGLKSAGLVKSRRGAKGGYLLARAPETITVLEVIEALDGPLSITDCAAQPGLCPRSPSCPTLPVWQEITGAAAQVARKTTLAQLANPKKRGKTRR